MSESRTEADCDSAFFNDITYVTPKVPTMYSVMSSGNQSTETAIYGENTNAFILEKGQIVDIILNNEDAGKHPFHLHGHNFQVVWRSEEEAGDYNVDNSSQFPAVPMRRDTLMVRPLGNFVVRFVADNPGVWLFHCHIEWHLVTGLAATMIEAPLDMQKSLTIPQDHYDACKAGGFLYAGNAAGNTENLLDLNGEATDAGRIPDGFTAKGIVALVFSIVAAFLGMAAIAWCVFLCLSHPPLRHSGGMHSPLTQVETQVWLHAAHSGRRSRGGAATCRGKDRRTIVVLVSCVIMIDACLL